MTLCKVPISEKNLKLGGFKSPISTTKNGNFGTKLGKPLKVPIVNPFRVSNTFWTLSEKNAPTFSEVPISKKKSQIGGFLSPISSTKNENFGTKISKYPKERLKNIIEAPNIL